jgi:hypothetical protein
MATAQKTSFVPLAPIRLVKPNGRAFPYGLGATTSALRGAALEAAVTASVAGDTIEVYGGSYTIENSLVLDTAGVSLLAIGEVELIDSTVTSCVISTHADNLTIRGFRFTDVVTCAVGILNDTPRTITGLVIEDCTVTSSLNTAVQFTGKDLGSTSHTVGAIIRRLVAPDCTGIAIFAQLLTGSYLRCEHCSVQGDVDGILIRGYNEVTDHPVCDIWGGYYESEQDGITAGNGARINVAGGAKCRGFAQADINGDGGDVYVDASVNFRQTTIQAGGPTEVYLTAYGVDVPIVDGPIPYFGLVQATTTSAARTAIGATAGVFPVAAGGTGAGTLTGIVKGNGTSAMTAVTAPSGAIVGTTDAQELTNKTITSPTITGGSHTGMTDITVADGGTGASTAAGARANLGVNVRTISIVVFPPTTDVVTGDGKVYIHVPPALNGGDITYVHAFHVSSGTTGTSDYQIARIRSGTPADVLSTKLTVDSGENGSNDATPAVINTSNDDLATNDVLRIDVDAVSTTKPKGLTITIGVTL